MSECRFGYGIENHGELVTSPEQHRLLAKRAWMQLHKYFLTNNEIFKALRIPVPWSLEEDLEVRETLERCLERIQKFGSEDELRTYINKNEEYGDEGFIKAALAQMRNPSPRRAWVLDLVRSFSPESILDIGSGCGELPVLLGSEGYNVTGITANKESCRYLNEYALEEKLPIKIVDGLFEYMDFGDMTFDVVVAAEVIEHVQNDAWFLEKCASVAEKAIVITTPVGSCDGGFLPNSKWVEDGAHIRSYSGESFDRLVNRIPEPIYCFCAVLVKETADDHHGIAEESESKLRV